MKKNILLLSGMIVFLNTYADQLTITNKTGYPLIFSGQDAYGNQHHGSLKNNQTSKAFDVDFGSYFNFRSNIYGSAFSPWQYDGSFSGLYNLVVYPPTSSPQETEQY